MLHSYANFIEQNKVKILFISLFIVFAPMFNLQNLGLSNDMRVFFAEESHHRASLDLLEETFGQQENLLIYIEDKSGSLFNKKSLTAIAELTDILWQTPYSKRIDSLTNFQRTSATEDELIVDFLAEDPQQLSDDDIQSIEIYATNEPRLKNRLISQDGKATAINITFSLPSVDPNTMEDETTIASLKAKAFVDQQVGLTRSKNPQLIIETGGIIASNLAMAEAVETDVGVLVPLSYLVLLIVIYLCTKSLAGVAIALTIVSLSIVNAFSIFSFFNLPLTPAASFVPTAIMAIAIADVVHYLSSYFHEVKEGREHPQATMNALINNAKPIIITSLTTVAGLLGLNFSDAPPYRDMGNLMAMGVISALFLTLTFLPALLLCLPPLKTKGQVATSSLLNNLANFVIKNPRAIVVSTTAILVVAAFGITKNEISERWYLYYDDEYEVTRSLDKLEKNLSGIHSIHYTLDSGIREGINNPDFWREVELFADWFKAQEGVVNIDSMLDILKSTNKSMNNDNNDFYTLPDTREQIAQYLLVYELSLPNGLGTEAYVNTDRSAIRFSVTLKKSNSKVLTNLDESAKQWIALNSTHIKPTYGTGLDIMFNRIAQENAVSLLYGAVVVLTLVSFVLILALQSLPLGIASLLPNISPALLAYGIWGYANGIIGLSSSLVICICLGIVVDDTVHFLSKYQNARKSKGLNSKEAVKYTFDSVGNALVITTIALVACFAILVFSQFQPSANLGALLALTLGAALAIDLLLLPSLLVLFDKKK